MAMHWSISRKASFTSIPLMEADQTGGGYSRVTHSRFRGVSGTRWSISRAPHLKRSSRVPPATSRVGSVADRDVTIGIDIGGTKVLGVTVDANSKATDQLSGVIKDLRAALIESTKL